MPPKKVQDGGGDTLFAEEANESIKAKDVSRHTGEYQTDPYEGPSLKPTGTPRVTFAQQGFFDILRYSICCLNSQLSKRKFEGKNRSAVVRDLTKRRSKNHSKALPKKILIAIMKITAAWKSFRRRKTPRLEIHLRSLTSSLTMK